MLDGARRGRLLNLLRERSLRFGEFTLASGQKSDYYIDGKLTTLDGEGAAIVGEAIYDLIRDDGANCVGGLTLGADPVVTAVAIAAYRAGKSLPAFIVRKAVKDHGTGKPIEGPFPEHGARAVVVEDVCSTGASALQAVAAVRAAFGEVVRVVSVVDRAMGAAKVFADLSLRYSFLFGKDELLAGGRG